MTTTLLIDDTRSFADGREAVVTRSSAEALAYVAENPHVTELWLDYCLVGMDDVAEFFFALRSQAKTADSPVITAERVYYHSSSGSGYSLVAQLCEDLGLPVPVNVDAKDFFTE